jgi:D-glycero-D-manno-heptose 1,7-bisphosphate phosphatase
MDERYDESVQPTSHSLIRPRLQTVFLDRDGVINEKMPEGQYVCATEDFHILPGAGEAIGRLNRSGVRVIVASNQRGVALGLYSAEDVRAIHEFLQRTLGDLDAHVDAFYFCPHGKGECSCRKPQTGLYDQAVVDFPDITPGTSVMVGDSLSDIEFGRLAGMRTVLVEGDPRNRRAGTEAAKSLADFTCASLSEAVDLFVERDFIPRS